MTTSEPPRIDPHSSLAAPARRVALFDIDGTLIRAGDAAHREAFDRALVDVYGVPATLAGISLGGMLDRQIARQALAPFAVDPEVVEGRLDQLMEVMGGHYLALAGEGIHRPEMLPGLPRVADALADAGVALAVVTGSAEPVARAKLDSCGLAELFPTGAYGDQADHRGTLVSMGLAAAGAHVGYRFDPTEAVVVGDTPRDIEAARHAGTRVIAVASGVFPKAELAVARPDALFDDLCAIDDVVAAVLGPATMR
jgi:phosphoglycolate phosphatase